MEPGIDQLPARHVANGAYEGDAARRQATGRGLDIGAVVLASHVLHDSDRDHRIVSPRRAPVVLESDFHRQARAALPGQGRLLLRDRQRHHFRAMTLGRELGEAAPAAAQLENAHAAACADLAADQLELCLLRRFEIVRRLPVAAGVDHAPIEHRPVEIVADVVVLLSHLEGPLHRLQIEELRLHDVGSDPRIATHLIVDARGDHPGGELVDRLAVPPALHVSLAESQRAVAKHPSVEARIVNRDVVRRAAADPDRGALQPPPNHRLAVARRRVRRHPSLLHGLHVNRLLIGCRCSGRRLVRRRPGSGAHALPASSCR